MSEAERARQQRRSQLDALWRRVERERRVRVTADDRAFVEAFQGIAEPEMYTDEDDIVAVMEQFVEHGLPVLRQLRPGPRKLKRAPSRGRTIPPARPHRYQKPFQKRLELLGFVAERVVPFPNLLEGSCETKGERIPWKQVCEAWNAAYPCDTKTRETLKREYFRARNEGYLCHIYFFVLGQESAEALAGLQRLAEVAEELGTLAALGRAELEGTIRPQWRWLLTMLKPIPSQEWRKSLDAFRGCWVDRLPRKLLLFYRLADCLLGEPAGGLPLRPLTGVGPRADDRAARAAASVGDHIRMGWARRRAIEELADEYAVRQSSRTTGPP